MTKVVKEKKVKWLESTGGPFVLFEAEYGPFWRGTSGSDYEDVCGVPPDLLDVLERSWGRVYIIGEEPVNTTVVNRLGRPAIVQCNAADSNEEFMDVVQNFIASHVVAEKSMSFSLGGRKLRLTDSAGEGSDVARAIDFDCPESDEILCRYVKTKSAWATIFEFLSTS